MPPLPRLPLPDASEIKEGAAAIAEAAAVAGGLDLSNRASLNKVKKLLRRDKMDDHLHRILVALLYFAALCVAGVFGSLVWNMAAPAIYRFLDAAQMTVLEQFLFSGAVGSAVTAAAKKVAGTESEKVENQ